MTMQINKLDWANSLLEGIARKIQLNKTDHEKAVDRYYRIADYLSGMHTEIIGLNPVIYPQGSFRTRSTISSYRDEDYDIDLILELLIDRAYDPEAVINFIADLMEQGKAKLQFDRVERKRRCVSLKYKGMHLDITPAVLIDPNSLRLVSIFDTNPERPDHVLANPEGFARWFDEAVLPYETRSKFTVQAKTFPVPDQEPLEAKPLRLLSLQLLKRFRDIACDLRNYDRCPSVLLSKLVALAPTSSTGGLLADLTVTTRFVRDRLNVDDPYEENPVCSHDLFTDRWPTDTKAHLKLVADLDRLLNALQMLVSDGTLVEKQTVLEKLFGERAAQSVFSDVHKSLAEKSRQGSLSAAAVSGAISVPTTTISANTGISVKPHRFYGE